MLGALKPGFRSFATLKLVLNVVSELKPKEQLRRIAQFPCDNTAFWYIKFFWLNSIYKKLSQTWGV